MLRTHSLTVVIWIAGFLSQGATFVLAQPEATQPEIAQPDTVRRPAFAHHYTGYLPGAQLPTEKPAVAWKHLSELKAERGQTPYMIGMSDVCYFDGHVYFGTDSGHVVALRADDGHEVWRTNTQFRIAMAPAADANFVYVGSRIGLLALDRQLGDVVWTRNIDGGADEADPVVIGEKLWFAAYDGFAYALDRSDGGVDWRTSLMQDVPPDPPGFESRRARFAGKPARPNGSSSDGNLLFQSMFDQSRVLALDCRTGETIWSFPTQGWTSPASTILGDRLFVGSQEGHVFCLDKHNGQLQWKFKTGSRISSRVAADRDSVYVVSCDGNLYRLNAEDGTRLWTFKTMPEAPKRTASYSFPIVTEQCVYFAAGEGQVYAIRIHDGRLQWRLRPIRHSELYTDLATDGVRLFAVARQGIERQGECAVLALAQ